VKRKKFSLSEIAENVKNCSVLNPPPLIPSPGGRGKTALNIAFIPLPPGEGFRVRRIVKRKTPLFQRYLILIKYLLAIMRTGIFR